MPDRPHDDLDNELTAEQSQARDGFWEFAQREVAPDAQARDDAEHTPRELAEAVAQQGYLAALPLQQHQQMALPMEEPTVRQRSLSLQGSLSGKPILPRQRR